MRKDIYGAWLFGSQTRCVDDVNQPPLCEQMGNCVTANKIFVTDIRGFTIEFKHLLEVNDVQTTPLVQDMGCLCQCFGGGISYPNAFKGFFYD